MEELWKATSEVVRERVSSPLLLPFITSWSIWNYKFFVVILSANGVEKTFQLIHQLYPDLWAIWVCPGQLGPVLTTLLLIFALPWAERLILKYTLPRQVQILDLRRDHANSIRLTLEQSQALRAEMLKRDKEHEEYITTQQQALEMLNQQHGSLQQSFNDLSERAARDPFFLTTSQLRSLQEFIRSAPGTGVLLEDLTFATRDIIPLLKSQGFIRDTTNERDGREGEYVMTRAGAVRLEDRPRENEATAAKSPRTTIVERLA